MTLWTAASHTHLPMGFSRQEYWSGLPFPSPGDLSDPGMELEPPTASSLAGGFFTTETPGKSGHIQTGGSFPHMSAWKARIA